MMVQDVSDSVVKLYYEYEPDFEKENFDDDIEKDNGRDSVDGAMLERSQYFCPYWCFCGKRRQQSNQENLRRKKIYRYKNVMCWKTAKV